MNRIERSFVVAALCAAAFVPSAFAASNALSGPNELAVGDARQPFMESGVARPAVAASVLAVNQSDMVRLARQSPSNQPSASLLEDLSVVKNAGAMGHLVNAPIGMVGAASWGIDQADKRELWGPFLVPAFGQIGFAIGIVIVALAGVFSMVGNLGAAVAEAAKGNFGMTKN